MNIPNLQHASIICKTRKQTFVSKVITQFYEDTWLEKDRTEKLDIRMRKRRQKILERRPTHFENHLYTSQTVLYQFPYFCESLVDILAQIHVEGKAQ